MKIVKLQILGVVTALACTVQLAGAECIPSEDPCAPKKKIGEWDTSVSVGANVTSGNSETTLLNLGARTALEEGADSYEFSAAYNYGEDDNAQNANGDKTTRNDFRGAGQYNHLIDQRWFYGLGAKVLYDEIADIDYRVNGDPLVGYYFMKDNTFKLRGEVGPSYVFEKVGSISDDYLAPRFGERFDWAITCTSKLFQTAEVLLDASDGDNYLFNGEVGLEAALSTNLALVTSVRYTYDGVPAEGREKDDMAFITAVKIAI